MEDVLLSAQRDFVGPGSYNFLEIIIFLQEVTLHFHRVL